MKEFPKFVKYRFREFGLFLQSKKKQTDERTINNRTMDSLLGTSVCDRPVSKKKVSRNCSRSVNSIIGYHLCFDIKVK